jgi:REP element-mobilizing transposase RayT
MPRKRRLHLPDAGFHITARTQNGAQHFTPEMRGDIADDIKQAAHSFGHTLLAYVVMPNHFHIVLKQGEAPLAWVMQRIMQRTVMRVRRAHGGEGHVFGRPYWAGTCTNPGYLRRAIVYTHLNPCKAGLCASADDYAWSSHSSYLRLGRGGTGPTSMLEGLTLFADRSLSRADVLASYQRFIDYCVMQRATSIPGDWLLPIGPNRHLLPSAAHGDSHWAANYSTFAEHTSFTRINIDVAHYATSLLERIDPDLDLDTIRLTGRSRTLGAVRRQLIEGLIVHGCRNNAISRCLRVSPSLVSQVATHMRLSAPRVI